MQLEYEINERQAKLVQVKNTIKKRKAELMFTEDDDIFKQVEIINGSSTKTPRQREPET